MEKGYSVMRDCVMHNPSGLSVLPKKLTDIAASYLPLSVGIEIECTPLNRHSFSFELACNELRDYVMELSVIGSESSFRLYPGINGIMGLNKVSKFLHKWYGLNPKSGIHYHIDCTANYDIMLMMNGNQKDWILKELDKWGYEGVYNSRNVFSSGMKGAAWAQLRSTYKTMEYRIGEMTFDYNILITRILHATYITRTVAKMITKSLNH